jgi:heavy metal efflux system protein
VAEVNSWGGLTERIEVVADPARLAMAGLTLGDVEEALARNNRNFGGAAIEDDRSASSSAASVGCRAWRTSPRSR